LRTIATLALLLSAIAGCAGGGRVTLPAPRQPLVRTPDRGDREAPPLATLAPLAVPPVHRETLESGLELQIVEQRDLPLVAVVLASRSFTSVDPAVRSGVGALTARVIERELARMALGAADGGRELEAPGVTLTHDGIVVVAQVPASELVRALSHLSAVVRSDDCHPHDVEIARIALDSLARRGAGTVGGIATTAVFSRLYGSGDRRGEPSWVDRETVASLRREDCIVQRRRGFVPAGSTLAIVGDVSAADAVAHARGTMAGWTRTGAAPTAMPAPAFPTASHNVLLAETRSPEGSVTLIERGPGARDPGYAAFGVLAQLVGGMFAAHLNLELRERRGWAYQVTAGHAASADHSVLRVECTVHSSRVVETLDLIEEELERLRDPDRIEDDELLTAIASERASLIERTSTRRGIASQIGLTWIRGQTLDELVDLDRRLTSLTASDVARAAGEIRIGGAPILLVGPREIEPAIESARPGRTEIIARPH
jgi:zinc protease